MLLQRRLQYPSQLVLGIEAANAVKPRGRLTLPHRFQTLKAMGETSSTRNHGAAARRPYHRWTASERERLLRLVELHPVGEVARMVRLSENAVRAMLKRLGASASMGKDWFTKYTLAQALRVRPEKVQQWIDRGWLKTSTIETRGARRVIIQADDFCRFCKEHRNEVIGHRLNVERLDFVLNFVFPPSHTELLPVRASKKERAAFDAHFRSTEVEDAGSNAEADLDEAESDLGLTA